MERVSIVGSSGSGKSTFGRALATRLDSTYVELDALAHLPDWQACDPEVFAAEVDAATPPDGRWVVDGHYSDVTMNGVVWLRADTVVVFDLPRRLVMWRLLARTMRRMITREELWNGNREPFTNLLRWDPERNVLRWSWVHHQDRHDVYRAAAHDDRHAHLDFRFITSDLDAARLLAGLSGPS